MKRAVILGLATAAMLSLAACGESNKSKLVKSCMADGADKKVCTCMADKLEANLTEDTFAAVAQAASSSEGEDELASLEDLSPMEQMSVGVNMMEAAVSCGLDDEN